jgi:hypothetical protein
MSALRRFAERFIRFSGIRNENEEEQMPRNDVERNSNSISPYRRSRLESSAIESEADVRRNMDFVEVNEFPDQGYFDSDDDGENSPSRSPNRKRVARANSRRGVDLDDGSENNSRSIVSAHSQRKSIYNQQKNQQQKKSAGDDPGFKFRRNKVDRLFNSNKGKVYRKEDRNMISNSLALLYENEILTDLTILVGDDSKEEIKAHKAILVR